MDVQTKEPEQAPPAAETAQPGAKKFDFRRPVFLSAPEWRKLRMEIEEFVDSLGSLLSTYLRMDFTLKLGNLGTAAFHEFTATMPARSHLVLFTLEPLRGLSVLELRPAIGLAIVDRVLGGPGKPASVDRDLTEMEVAMLDQSAQLMLGEWCKQWAPIQELRAEIAGHENNPKFLQCASGGTTMLALTLEARLGETVDQIQIAFPYATIEPLVSKLTEGMAQPSAPAATAPAPAQKGWAQNLDDVSLTLTAQWPALKVPTRAALALKPGDILDLPPEGSEKVELRVGKVAKFRGRLGTRDGKWAVQINTIFKTQA
jgi:flagellar motor switch protein FliM